MIFVVHGFCPAHEVRWGYLKGNDEGRSRHAGAPLPPTMLHSGCEFLSRCAKCERAGELARTSYVPVIAAAPVGDAPCSAKSIDDEDRAEVPASDWCSGVGVATPGPLPLRSSPSMALLLALSQKEIFRHLKQPNSSKLP